MPDRRLLPGLWTVMVGRLPTSAATLRIGERECWFYTVPAWLAAYWIEVRV